ncbi:hypothetical protein ACFPOE_01925 [Caenimonas terrae]|uniref:Uncharacterized protein n=1 Tax=Caenimonas terrae TaxID=696074 RepID=A0ABW0N7M4_9BURK
MKSEANTKSAHIDTAEPAQQAGQARKFRRPRAGAAIPVSSRPALALPHPMELFGDGFKVHLSTGVTFSPDTLARAVLDKGLAAAIRDGLPLHYQSLRKLLYIARGEHTPTSTTKKLLALQFEGILDRQDLERALAGESVPAAAASDWLTLLKGLQGDGGVLAQIASCLAACDAHVLEFVAPLALQSGREAAGAHLDALFGEERSAWQALNPRLLTHVIVLVEVALKTLAWLECRLEPGPAGRDRQRSGVDGLLAPDGRPMGNWLFEVCEASGCRDLGRLSQELLRRGSRHLKRPISHGLLRRWSSPKSGVMPRVAVLPVLAGVDLQTQVRRLESRYDVARFFTFLCDLLRAATVGEPRPSWEEVQAQVRSRYAQAYRLQVLHSSE